MHRCRVDFLRRRLACTALLEFVHSFIRIALDRCYPVTTLLQSAANHINLRFNPDMNHCLPASATLVDSCEPCINCGVNTICTPCWAYAPPTDNFCSDGSGMYSCAGVCKPNGPNISIGAYLSVKELKSLSVRGDVDLRYSPWGPCTTGQPFVRMGCLLWRLVVLRRRFRVQWHASLL